MNDRSFVCVKVVFRFSPPIKQITESCDKTKKNKIQEISINLKDLNIQKYEKQKLQLCRNSSKIE